jgi:hypothetical protein
VREILERNNVDADRCLGADESLDLGGFRNLVHKATNVGWLNDGATLEWVSEQTLKCGLKSYDLSQPKPGCVRPQDGQITTIPVGGTWLQRVRQM